MPNSAAEAKKAEGNSFFKNKQYAAAIAKYKEATAIDPSVPAYWSNMAACHEKLSQFEEMSAAAKECIRSNNKFVKGYFRLATAQKALDDLGNCIKTLESGLAVESGNPDLKRMKKEIIELQRGDQVATYCRRAEEQMQSGDISAAHKTLDLASRIDAGNSDIERMMSKVKPKFDAQEKRRKAGLSQVEIYKERGDEAYKTANFEGAIEHYGKCINALRSQRKTEDPLMMKALSNRAACFKQISNFDGVIEDSSAVLEVEPNNVKALVRRAQAFEGVERYRFALQDCKSVLQFPFNEVGKVNFDLCNMMQHRLNRTVAQLKAMG
mmetsp:Transcript_52780/g.61640  ORF Transcript_52780/g.61640 Transcript_52780/m.61640 type:complete len:324 (-) Transcript_52780:216-1187(-)|eukprot:CAMPEP_0194351868 /NCGR_PEP_ID=MMETSP0174-20130528/242_1 /TAXON_ID=216777 /ORGANISM="Proboscia alata, Strain PI-D3" /LENGTH=323 /DNA_ID=CAMNT_0039119587 /DNA_START=56 /DNA_END=1027 /DNA_ORIENTATION=+